MGNRAGWVSGAAAPHHLVATPTEGAPQLVPEPSILVARVPRSEPWPLPPPRARRGRPAVALAPLFVQALGGRVVRPLPRVPTLFAVPPQPPPSCSGCGRGSVSRGAP